MADIVSFCCHEAGAFDSLSGLSAVRESATEWGAGMCGSVSDVPFGCRKKTGRGDGLAAEGSARRTLGFGGYRFSAGCGNKT